MHQFIGIHAPGGGEIHSAGAILRWNEAGAGAAVTKTAGIYGQTVDTRQLREAMFSASEVDQLKKLCRSGGDGGGAFAIDLIGPAAPRLSARQQFERDIRTNW